VVGFTTGSRGKVPGKTCEKRIRNNNNNNNNNNKEIRTYFYFRELPELAVAATFLLEFL
jgi:hypothetical protein